MPELPASPSSAQHGYGRVARALHWLMALAILAAIGLGMVMTNLPATSEAEVAQVFKAYSIHKTLGVLILAFALLRLGWSLGHSAPGPLHPDRRAETFLAQLVHGLLWGAMLILPVSGWLHHSAAPGFAPILWPFGQSLPLVTPDEGRALVFRSVHAIAGWLLIAAISLHIAGALKHTFVDRDATLSRMIRGSGPAVPPAGPARASLLAVLVLWAATLLVAILAAPAPELDPFDSLDSLGTIDESAPPAD